MKKIKLILDLDGVMITTPSWKQDVMHSDGYSDFNKSCVVNLNKLLEVSDFEIWLSSSRRTHKTLVEFNTIFKNRGINKEITGFIPIGKNRFEEISYFINFSKLPSENKFSIIDYSTIPDYLIIDDDKTLNVMTDRLILTDSMLGFNNDKLQEALETIKK